MRHHLFPLALLAAPLALAAQAPLTHTASGVQAEGPQLTLRVEALRDDVLRVRVFPNGHPAEDASWAVLPASRTAHVTVTAEAAGFSTAALHVKVSDGLRLTVTDLSGNVIQQDALPVAWSTDGFAVSKVKTGDDHFFGLGDKPGPLDRAGESSGGTFTLTDADAIVRQERDSR